MSAMPGDQGPDEGQGTGQATTAPSPPRTFQARAVALLAAVFSVPLVVVRKLKRRAKRLSPTSKKGLKGVGWVSLSQGLTMAMRLASNLILTRLLKPGDYGVYGTAMAITMTLEFFSDTGVVPALIRHPRGKEPQFLLTGWWMNLGRGTLLSSALAVAAWPLSIFYGRPELAPVLLVLGLRPAVVSLRSPAIPTLRRELSFREVFISEFIQSVVGVGVSVLLVWWFRSVWAIALGTLTGALVMVGVSYLIRPMRPRWFWSGAVARELAHVGRQVFLNTLLMGLWLNLDRLTGLRMVTAAQLGYYTVAWNMVMIAERLVNRVGSVYYSMLAKTEDLAARRRWHEAMARRLTHWMMPLLSLGVIASPWVIRILYDKRYILAQGPMVVLMGRLMLRGLARVQSQYLLSIAKLHLETRAYVASFLTQLVLLWPMVKTYGIVGMALSSLITTFVLVAIQSLMLRLRDGVSMAPLYRTTGWMLVGLGVAWGILSGQW